MSQTPVDLLPLIPGRDGSQNAARALREAFQDALDGRLYPKKVAEYIINCQIDDEMKIKENAERVLQMYDTLNDLLETIENSGREIMEQQGSYLIKKDRINSFEDLKERIRLQHCYLFKNLRLFHVDYFGLLQKSDLLPDVLKRFLDYRINDRLHLCQDCLKKVETAQTPPQPVTKERYKKDSCEDIIRRLRKKDGKTISKDSFLGRGDLISRSQVTCDENFYSKLHKDRGRSPFVVAPDDVQFDDCIPGMTYKRKLKLTNTSGVIQHLAIRDYPKFKSLSVSLDMNSKLAPGMSCSAKIVYKPEVYRNICDYVSFRNQLGFTKYMSIRAMRDSPKLITCICRANNFRMDRPRPGSNRFQEDRREALNSSIDCGSCLVGEYIYLSVFVQNIGTKGKFFIITEDEWYSENIETITSSMEYSSESLWIYPTFFELDTNDTMEINILFFPSKPDVYLEKFYFICDNNSFQQFEVIGDALMFNLNMLKIDVPPNDKEVNKKEDYCIVFGNFPSNSSLPLIITVHNSSSLILGCYWKLEKKFFKSVIPMDLSWIEFVNCPNQLAPYSTTDFVFKINLDTPEDGCYNIIFK